MFLTVHIGAASGFQRCAAKRNIGQDWHQTDACQGNNTGATLLVYSSELDSQQNNCDFAHYFQCTKVG